MDYKKIMVAGFLFDTDRQFVALIRKNKPEWQKGLWNGIGGKVEEFETAPNAMQREFLEETGVNIPASDWIPFARLEGKEWTVYFFKAFSGEIWNCKTMEEEVVSIMNTTLMNPSQNISNLS